MEDLSRRLVFENPGGFQPGPMSGDGRFLAVSKSKNNADSDVYLVDLENPQQDPRHLTPHEGDASHGPVTFNPGRQRTAVSDRRARRVRRGVGL